MDTARAAPRVLPVAHGGLSVLHNTFYASRCHRQIWIRVAAFGPGVVGSQHGTTVGHWIPRGSVPRYLAR